MLLKLMFKAFDKIDVIEVMITSFWTDWCYWSYDYKLLNRLMLLKINFTNIKNKLVNIILYIKLWFIDNKLIDWQQVIDETQAIKLFDNKIYL